MGLVVNAARARIGAQGDVAAVQGGRPAFRLSDGESVTLTAEGRAVVVDDGDRRRFEHLSFVSLRHDRFVTIDGRPFRGAIEVVARDGQLTFVNVVSLEEYLVGVVNAEMGPRGPAERAALEAQAVVSRTYALANRGRFGSAGYDLLAGVSDQVYGGVERETASGRAAVRATAGTVLTYRGRLIAPFFHSTCGGRTADPEESFQSVRARPYLRSVSDRKPGGFYCDISPRFSWRVEWDGATLRDILRRTVPGTLGIDADVAGVLRDVYVRRTGRSGRVTDLRIVVSDGEVPVPGWAVRRVLETPEGSVLGGSSVEIQGSHEGDRLTRLTVTGRGWGHGVGMCQWGAVGRARAGQDADTILHTYFPGTDLVRWY